MMTRTHRGLAVAILAGVLTVGLAAPVLAEGGDPPPPAKCNSGRGNNSETTPATDCDPGNSGGHNNGGD